MLYICQARFTQQFARKERHLAVAHNLTNADFLVPS